MNFVRPQYVFIAVGGLLPSDLSEIRPTKSITCSGESEGQHLQAISTVFGYLC